MQKQQTFLLCLKHAMYHAYYVAICYRMETAISLLAWAIPSLYVLSGL